MGAVNIYHCDEVLLTETVFPLGSLVLKKLWGSQHSVDTPETFAFPNSTPGHGLVAEGKER